ncbi:MAG TPA: protein kinase [Phycisphaerales bacterium]|nr:protein kinase [Phycisphaerales bacterium]HMP37621.1 protein kinase [Phycisphaerales bacterium]
MRRPELRVDPPDQPSQDTVEPEWDPEWDAERLLGETLRRREAARSTGDVLRELLDGMEGPRLARHAPNGAPGGSESHTEAAEFRSAGVPLPLPAISATVGSGQGDSSDRPDVVIPNHTLLRRVGEGGFGQVWIAHNPLTDHHRACKLVPHRRTPELDGLRRLKQRVPAHRNLMPIEDVGVAGDWLYCLMPLAENAHSAGSRLDVGGYEATTLRLVIDRRGRIPPAESAAIGAALASALAHLHDHGVTHGDVKPGNVLRLDGHWTLGDFGLLRDLSRPTGSGETRDYAPPEGPGSPKADQFALGVVLFELASGRPAGQLPAFGAAPDDELLRSAPGRRLREAILRATAADPAGRHPSMRELEQALRRIAERPGRRLGIAAAALGLCVLLAGGLSFLPSLLARDAESRDADPAAAALLGDAGERAGQNAQSPARGAAAEPPSIVRFEIRQSRFDGANDRLVGILGADSDAARIDDDLSLAASFSAPAFIYLLSLDVDGAVSLRDPGSETIAPNATREVRFPADHDLVFRLTSGPGAQGFLLLACGAPLPPWRDFAAQNGIPPWTPFTLEVDGVWTFDGRSLLLEGATRGDVLPRRGGPAALAELIDWIGSLSSPRAPSPNDPSSSIPALDAARLVVVPVR